jgi:hypothetical protein
VSAVKRSKVDEQHGPTNVLSLSGMDLEEEEEGNWMGRGGGVSHPPPRTEANHVLSAVTTNGFGSGRGSRSETPPGLIDEAEIDRKVKITPSPSQLSCVSLHCRELSRWVFSRQSSRPLMKQRRKILCVGSCLSSVPLEQNLTW